MKLIIKIENSNDFEKAENIRNTLITIRHDMHKHCAYDSRLVVVNELLEAFYDAVRNSEFKPPWM